MKTLLLKGRPVVRGEAEASALVTKQAISFFGGINPKTGLVTEKNHELYGQKISGKFLVFPCGKGSSVGSYVIYAMSKYGTNPAGIINRETEVIIASGCALANIPLIDLLELDPVEKIKTSDQVRCFKSGFVQIIR